MTISEVQQKLEQAFTADQAAQKLDLDKARQQAEQNVLLLKQVVDEYGWPTISQFGADTAYRAWNIAQHADKDLEFQEKCLALMLALPEGEVEKQNIAYLTDRVKINKGEAQVYGTQIANRKDYYVLKPTVDLEHIDQRRAEMGMNTLQEYFRLYSKPVYLTEAEASQGSHLQAAA